MIFSKTLERFRNNFLRGRVIFVMDLILSMLASGLSIIIVRAVLSPSAFPRPTMWPYMLTAFAASAGLFLLMRTYRIIIRHFTPRDGLPFIHASVGKVLLILAVVALAGRFSSVLLLTLLLDFSGTLILLIGVRALMIFVYSEMQRRVQEKYQHQRLFVYGTSEKSVATILRLSNSSHYLVAGILKRGAGRENKVLNGVPVVSFSNEEEFLSLAKSYRVDAVLFATDADAKKEDEGVVSFCSRSGIKTLIVPKVSEGLGDNALLRELRMEDILGREEIVISMDVIRENLRGTTVLVTGAAGSIGSELVRQLATFGVERIVLYDNAETPMHNLRLELEDRFPKLSFVPVIGDVRHPERLDFAFRTYKPDVVFHAAAYKHVPLMEENPCEAVLVNVNGTRYVADKCVEYGVRKMVMISTDKAVNPTNIMGCSKRIAEIYVQSLGLSLKDKDCVTRFVTTRFGNVLGSNGSVILRFRDQIAKGGPVTVTHPDITRFFMTIPEACRLVLEAAVISTGNEIFVFDMGEPVKIDYLARRMIALAGLVPGEDIEIKYTGLRPGEKLYEEVLSNEENTIPTAHSRIRVAKVRSYSYEDALTTVNRLHELARQVDIPNMVRLMKEMVPEYKSKNSKYEIYDKEN